MIFQSPGNKSGFRTGNAFCRGASRILLAAGTLFPVAGCEIVEKVRTDFKTVAAAHPLIGKSPGQIALAEGVELYDKGEFTATIKHLSNNQDIWSADKGTQTKALKYMAFSYCVTSRQVLCRQQFEKAFRLDSGFDLEPGEKGHPLWGRAFELAKRSR